MPDVLKLNYGQLRTTAARFPVPQFAALYGVPRGGVYAALLVNSQFPHATLCEDPEDADVIIDDIIDSGVTRDRYKKLYPDKPFLALVDKQGRDSHLQGRWVEFPWERGQREGGPEDAVRRLLEFIGEDPNREGLLETPSRVIRSYQELFAGYKQKPEDLMKVFEDGACDELILVKGIEVVSFCEHHLLPFLGKAHVAYVPDKKIIGLSKIARLVDVFARRLQVQERLTVQITDALNEHLKPLGSACVIEAQHLCLAVRGARKQDSTMVTSSLTGVFRKPEVRAEFLSMVK